MLNPFEEWMKAADSYRVIEGEFACQEPDCFWFNTTATYNSEAKTLEYECEAGHYNKVEKYHVRTQ